MNLKFLVLDFILTFNIKTIVVKNLSSSWIVMGLYKLIKSKLQKGINVFVSIVVEWDP